MAGKLLRAPNTADTAIAERAEVRFQRPAAEYADLGEDKFRLARRDFQRQYFDIYRHRLNEMRPRVEASVRSAGVTAPIRSLCDDVRRGSEVVLVGTVAKEQPLRPSILKELSEGHGLLPQPAGGAAMYVSDEDEVLLEDETQRIRLRGENVETDLMATGVVVAVLGTEKDPGKFDVVRIFYAAPGDPQPQRPLPEKDRFVVFISGLELSDRNTRCLPSAQLAVDWIVGEAGEMDDQRSNADIVRVVIAGNSLNETTRDKEDHGKAKYLTKDNKASSIEAVGVLDNLLVQLASSVDTDIMPGEFDPANQILPQQPLHPCLFPMASVYPTMKSATNPYMFSVGGTNVTGTSGQNIDDLLRNTRLESALDGMECTMRWSHLAPTCPDTLGCFPYTDSDPFIAKSRPHVNFVGNQKFGQRWFKQDGETVKMISLPKFSETNSFVVLNLRNLEAKEVFFDGFLD